MWAGRSTKDMKGGLKRGGVSNKKGGDTRLGAETAEE